jgi:HD-GYP domain-containing protein (c-di-GMP phosphodiesterase class II)
MEMNETATLIGAHELDDERFDMCPTAHRGRARPNRSIGFGLMAIPRLAMSSATTETERVRMAFSLQARTMPAAERRAELVLAGLFLPAAMALAVFGTSDAGVSIPLALVYVVTLTAAGRVRFEIGAGFTVPTQVAFVPMLFALPPAIVPLLVALSLVLGLAPAVARGGLPRSRMLAVPGNSWFALGPALVLTVSGAHRPDRQLGVLVAALAAQFACDFAANCIRERLRRGISIRDLVDETRTVYLLDIALSPVGLAVALAAASHSWAVLLVLPLFGPLSYFSRERHKRLQQLIELNDAYRGTAVVLGEVVAADDNYTGEHSRGVVALALEVAAELELDAARRLNVEFAALLHDVGKITVPNGIINKPGQLDEWEWELIKRHTIEGQRILEPIGGLMRNVGRIVRSSHERWDGDGYPDGLRGDAIPLEARIIAVCDAVSAMTTNRSYRSAMPVELAIEELQACAEAQFDPRVVEALVQILTRDRQAEAIPVRERDLRRSFGVAIPA